MKKSRKLKLSTIIAAGADCDQVDLFSELFGESVMVTIKLAESVANKFDWNWAANNLLSSAALKLFYADAETSWALAYAATNAAWKRFYADTAAAWKRYCSAIATLWARTYINDGEGT